MARIRTVKPSFFRSRSVKKLSDKAKLAWIALWNVADDEGRLVDELGILTGDLWALSLSELRLDKILDDLYAENRIVRYEVAGQGYIQVTNWDEHQKINRPTPSLIPPVPLTASSVSAHGGLTGGKERKRNGKEGEATSVAEPPLFCPSHLWSNNRPACPNCADARRVHEGWERAQLNRPTVSGIVTDPDCKIHPGRPKRGCDRCAEEAAA